MLALGGDDHDVRVPRVLADLGLPATVADRPVAQLSGGQQVKVNLAAVLLSRFDVLLLDEPTNNLDFDGLERLGRFLDGADAGVVLVSHDRALLADHTTRIAEIDFHSHRLDEFGGGFTAYMEERRLRREQAYARYDIGAGGAGPAAGVGPAAQGVEYQPAGPEEARQGQVAGRSAEGAVGIGRGGRPGPRNPR